MIGIAAAETEVVAAWAAFNGKLSLYLGSPGCAATPIYRNTRNLNSASTQFSALIPSHVPILVTLKEMPLRDNKV